MDTLKQYITYNNIIKVLQNLKYTIFEDKLNITVIRTNNQYAGKFDDYLILHDNKEIINVFICTADPSDLHLQNPLSDLGCAILTLNQHIDKWTIGKHKGYEALVQCRPLTVVRDYNKDNILNYTRPIVYDKILSKTINYNKVDTWIRDGKTIYVEETGIFGINVHRASQYNTIDNVGLYSAGCIVIQKPTDFTVFMQVVNAHKQINNNKFTVNIVLENQLRSVIPSVRIETIPNLITKPKVETNTLTSKYGIRL